MKHVEPCLIISLVGEVVDSSMYLVGHSVRDSVWDSVWDSVHQEVKEYNNKGERK